MKLLKLKNLNKKATPKTLTKTLLLIQLLLLLFILLPSLSKATTPDQNNKAELVKIVQHESNITAIKTELNNLNKLKEVENKVVKL
jgi:competence protein ComGC